MDYKEALKNLNNSKVVTVLFNEELETIAKALSSVTELENEIKKLSEVCAEVKKSDDKYKEYIKKANDFDKMCDLIFDEDAYLWNSVHFKWVEQKENPDGYSFLRKLVEDWKDKRKSIDGK